MISSAALTEKCRRHSLAVFYVFCFCFTFILGQLQTLSNADQTFYHYSHHFPEPQYGVSYFRPITDPGIVRKQLGPPREIEGRQVIEVIELNPWRPMSAEDANPSIRKHEFELIKNSDIVNSNNYKGIVNQVQTVKNVSKDSSSGLRIDTVQQLQQFQQNANRRNSVGPIEIFVPPNPNFQPAFQPQFGGQTNFNMGYNNPGVVSKIQLNRYQPHQKKLYQNNFQHQHPIVHRKKPIHHPQNIKKVHLKPYDRHKNIKLNLHQQHIKKPVSYHQTSTKPHQQIPQFQHQKVNNVPLKTLISTIIQNSQAQQPQFHGPIQQSSVDKVDKFPNNHQNNDYSLNNPTMPNVSFTDLYDNGVLPLPVMPQTSFSSVADKRADDVRPPDKSGNLVNLGSGKMELWKAGLMLLMPLAAMYFRHNPMTLSVIDRHARSVDTGAQFEQRALVEFVSEHCLERMLCQWGNHFLAKRKRMADFFRIVEILVPAKVRTYFWILRQSSRRENKNFCVQFQCSIADTVEPKTRKR